MFYLLCNPFEEALNSKEWNSTPIKMQVYDEREENNRREKTYITKFDRFLRARSVHHCCCEWKMWSRVYIESPFFTLWKNSILLPWKELKEVQTETIIHCYCTQDQLEINTMKRYSFSSGSISFLLTFQRSRSKFGSRPKYFLLNWENQ